LLGSRFYDHAGPLVLLPVYVMPAIFVLWLGYESFALEIIWILPLLGLLVSGKDALRWSLPRAWRWPLTAWALVIAVSWPIIFLRENDFNLEILWYPGTANTTFGITPWDAVLNVTYFALGHNVGLLWIDALYRWYSNQPRAMATRVLMPLAATAIAACLVGLYQGTVDLTFLSAHLWAHMGRAAGTTADANTFGMIAAFWSTGFVLLARRLPMPWSVVLGLAGVGLAIGGVWTSGSRTALAVIALGPSAMAVEAWRAYRSDAGRAVGDGKRLILIGAGVAVLAVFVLLITQSSSTTTVLGRGGLLPEFSEVGLKESVRRQFWVRNGYGPAAINMIKDHALVGVGVGAFHTLVRDFGIESGYILAPDNAQNWIRHLLAEIGVLGLLPVLWWCSLFARDLFSRARPGSDYWSVVMLRWALVAFGLLSMLGMPGQSLPVILTFWTFVFWFKQASGQIEHEPAEAPSPSRRLVVSIALLVALHAGLTVVAARGDLRPRNRALHFGWNYRYGISDVERSADGSPGRMWTERRSLSQVPVRGRVLKFVGWIDHPDADEHPVQVRVWADSRKVYDGDLKRSAAIMLDIAPTPGRPFITIETEISRQWRPRDFGRDDPRVLGLSIRDWLWE